uniref:Uncharacterized protein n=1 Tax=Romanomermis culicivorax TaxID=13658 RepID=A0A915JUU5_ROMCU
MMTHQFPEQQYLNPPEDEPKASTVSIPPSTFGKRVPIGNTSILDGMATATAAVTNQTALGKTEPKYDWLRVTCTEIRLVAVAAAVAVP